ncbi:hypothetical protein FCM35_KLT05521 [Carex littledalei]|uniref:DUF4283 domain-containing protein n=1 Tax=Carex littledalei TaxID=544730 RepID=A0A833QPH8_9POAL|nr:hypothetical protein FCM35_KLT05521 [Carex littledalei]
MEAPYPYGDTLPNSTSVFAPKTPHSTLLENDATHSIMVCFIRQSTNRNPAVIQHKLTQLYGGLPSDDHILTLSAKAYLLQLPEFLNRKQVLHDLLLWSVSNHVHLWRWEHEANWNHTPQSFKVYLKVLNYPLQLWHPHYFHLMVAGFGMPLYVDDENTIASDRSFLRIAIRCIDPSKIPEIILLHYDDKWRRCIVEVLGWSLSKYRGHDATHGPFAGGRQLDLGWPRGGPPYNQPEDDANRLSLVHAHTTFLRQSDGNRQPTQGHTLLSAPPSLAGSMGPYREPSSWKDLMKNQSLPLQTLHSARRAVVLGGYTRHAPNALGSSMPKNLIAKLYLPSLRPRNHLTRTCLRKPQRIPPPSTPLFSPTQ